jgi:hypothetical protein
MFFIDVHSEAEWPVNSNCAREWGYFLQKLALRMTGETSVLAVIRALPTNTRDIQRSAATKDL